MAVLLASNWGRIARGLHRYESCNTLYTTNHPVSNSRKLADRSSECDFPPMAFLLIRRSIATAALSRVRYHLLPLPSPESGTRC